VTDLGPALGLRRRSSRGKKGRVVATAKKAVTKVPRIPTRDSMQVSLIILKENRHD